MYCQQQEASCEWRFLRYVGRYFKSLDDYLTSVYNGLLTAIDEASGQLAAGKAPEYYKNVCTHANVTVLTCEILRIETMFGKNCSKPQIVLPRECYSDDNELLDWPVEPAEDVNIFGKGCWWPRIPGKFDNMRKLLKFARFLSSRLLHLVTAQGLCGGADRDNVLSEALLTSIYEAGLETEDRARAAYLVTGGPKVINEVANDFEGLVWPDSEDDVKKYEQLKTKIEEAFLNDYSSNGVRAYLVFYPCKEDAFAVLKDVSTENAFIFVRRPDVNVMVGRGADRDCDWYKWPGVIEEQKDAIANAYKNAKGNTVSYRLQQVDKLFKWRSSGEGCSIAVVAIECAYKFSWLELGWTYFPAWYYDDTNFKSVEVRSESPLSPMCADIVFY